MSGCRCKPSHIGQVKTIVALMFPDFFCSDRYLHSRIGTFSKCTTSYPHMLTSRFASDFDDSGLVSTQWSKRKLDFPVAPLLFIEVVQPGREQLTHVPSKTRLTSCFCQFSQ